MKSKRLRHPRTPLIAIAIASIVVVSVALIWAQNYSGTQTTGVKAAIVDQLSLTSSNPAFVEAATKYLREAGYSVDYFPGQDVTVEFFRNLPSQGYRFLVLRVEAAADSSGAAAALFTSEPYSAEKYPQEQLSGQLGRVWYDPEGGAPYFGVSQEFVKQSMKGRFPNSLILMMDGKGIFFTLMGTAFVERGARTIVGWSDTVDWSFTELGYYSDYVAARFLQHLLGKKQTLNESITETMAEVGPDPLYESKLVYYPLDSEFILMSAVEAPFSSSMRFQSAGLSLARRQLS